MGQGGVDSGSPELLKDVSNGEAGWDVGVSAETCPAIWDGSNGVQGGMGAAVRQPGTATQPDKP